MFFIQRVIKLENTFGKMCHSVCPNIQALPGPKGKYQALSLGALQSVPCPVHSSTVATLTHVSVVPSVHPTTLSLAFKPL